MDARESLMVLNKVLELSDTGQHAAVVDYLGTTRPEEIGRSPTLALLYGIALARRGRHADGQRWVDAALELARERGDRAVEARALNVQGAIALEGGRVDEAASYFMRALAEAKQQDDHATVGRCSNNLGIIANLRGDYGRAVGSYTMALAAFEQAGLRRGIGEAQHNLGITYRDQGDLVTALDVSERALREADLAGDRALAAQTHTGRAEIRIRSGDPEVGRREVERAISTHRELGDVVGETEDLRVFALALGAMGESADAERVLRLVIDRAETHGRPLLAAMGRRDLAHLCVRFGRSAEARDLALAARAQFDQLGAEAEVRKLDELLAERNR